MLEIMFRSMLLCLHLQSASQLLTLLAFKLALTWVVFRALRET